MAKPQQLVPNQLGGFERNCQANANKSDKKVILAIMLLLNT